MGIGYQTCSWRSILALAWTLALPRGAAAIDFVWGGANTWPSGSTATQTYTSVDGSNLDIEIVISNGAALVDSSPDGNPDSPEVNDFFAPVPSNPNPAGESLFVRARNNDGVSGITFTVNFLDGTGGNPTGVTNLSFSFYDVDFGSGQFTDALVLSGFAVGGGTVVPTSVLPVVTPGTESWTYDALTGTITGTGGSNNDDLGTAVVSFAGPITGFEFAYLNTETPPLAAQGNQWIGFSDLFLIPEPSPFGLLAPVLVAFAVARRRRG